MVRVPTDKLGGALQEVDAETRALLNLSLRRGMHYEEIAEFLRIRPQEVQRRRAEAIDGLAGTLQLDGDEACAELVATLPDLPERYWGATSE